MSPTHYGKSDILKLQELQQNGMRSDFLERNHKQMYKSDIQNLKYVLDILSSTYESESSHSYS